MKDRRGFTPIELRVAIAIFKTYGNENGGAFPTNGVRRTSAI